MIERCPSCFEKLLKAMIFEDGFMCDNCGAYAQGLTEERIRQLNQYIEEKMKEQGNE